MILLTIVSVIFQQLFSQHRLINLDGKLIVVAVLYRLLNIRYYNTLLVTFSHKNNIGQSRALIPTCHHSIS